MAGVSHRVWVATIAVLIGGAVTAAFAQTRNDTRVWTAISVRGQVNGAPRWQWVSDSIVRARGGASTLDLLAERVLVTRNLTDGSRVGFGYAYGAGFPAVGSLTEHRLVQQYEWSRGVSWSVGLRSRLEERFISGRDQVLLRGRQQVRVTWPLIGARGLKGVASEEVFVQNHSPLARSASEGNRVFIGISRTLTARSKVEIGYMNVYQRGLTGRDSHSHVLSVSLLVTR